MGGSTVVLMIISPINAALNIGLIHYTSLGVLGSPAALSITYWMSFLLLALYTYFSPTHRQNGTWGGIQLEAVIDVRSCYVFLELALPGILMVGTEWSVSISRKVATMSISFFAGLLLRLLHLQLED